jgi:hypothetical protein
MRPPVQAYRAYPTLRRSEDDADEWVRPSCRLSPHRQEQHTKHAHRCRGRPFVADRATLHDELKDRGEHRSRAKSERVANRDSHQRHRHVVHPRVPHHATTLAHKRIDVLLSRICRTGARTSSASKMRPPEPNVESPTSSWLLPGGAWWGDGTDRAPQHASRTTASMCRPSRLARVPAL